MKNRETTIKKQLVDEVHVTRKGEPRSITTHGATSSYPNGYVYTKLEGGKVIKSKDIAGLYDKLYDIYYKNRESPMAIRNIFELAIEEKRKTENPKEETLRKNRCDFNAYIKSDFSKKDITAVTSIELLEYTQELVNTLDMTKKNFLAYKGVLNLIFGYAIDHSLIQTNPVDKIKNKIFLKSCRQVVSRAEDKIFSPEEIQLIKDEIRRRMTLKKYGDYYITGYAVLFEIETGLRVGELMALKWSDINYTDRTIHIHSQQLRRTVNGKTEFYYVQYTKNERGISNNGRYFPLTSNIEALLNEIKEKQDALELDSDFIFCDENNVGITSGRYQKFLLRLCDNLNLNVSRNHAFRMSLNSNVLVQEGVAVTDRAALLGHSVETNIKYYCFEDKSYVDNVRDILDSHREPFDLKKEPYPTKLFERKKPQKPLLSRTL